MTVGRRIGNKSRAMIVFCLSYLWYSGATDIMIKRTHA